MDIKPMDNIVLQSRATDQDLKVWDVAYSEPDSTELTNNGIAFMVNEEVAVLSLGDAYKLVLWIHSQLRKN